MPRKQRFKPSRKPKPMPTAQMPEGTQRESSSMQQQQNEGARAPEEDHPNPVVDLHMPGRQDRIEAR